MAFKWTKILIKPKQKKRALTSSINNDIGKIENVCIVLSRFRHVQLFATLWTTAC